MNRPVTVFLCGDVMVGRGVDQILPHPGDPSLREAYADDARTYIELAEAVNGPIPRPVGFSWPWGEALGTLDRLAPDVRVINLETSVTRSGMFARGKGVHYRMHPDDTPCLTEARPDVCVLANNHVLDFGRPGLEETLDSLSAAGLGTAGAGRDAHEAWRPATLDVEGGGRVLVFSCGMASSGIPSGWAATADRPGVAFGRGPSGAVAERLARRVREIRRPGDVVLVSVHWGPNWGYEIRRDEVGFAHRLIDEGVDIVHGHSSHHPRPVEIYRDRPILYGCGDFIDDYEGIIGHEDWGDLRLMYLVSLDPDTGDLTGLRIVPLKARKMRLQHASGADRRWLRGLLVRVSRPFGTRIDLDRDGVISVHGP